MSTAGPGIRFGNEVPASRAGCSIPATGRKAPDTKNTWCSHNNCLLPFMSLLFHLLEFSGYKNIYGLSLLLEELHPSFSEDKPYVSIKLVMTPPYLVPFFPSTLFSPAAWH